jgi:hypothetical protein
VQTKMVLLSGRKMTTSFTEGERSTFTQLRKLAPSSSPPAPPAQPARRIHRVLLSFVREDHC